MRAALVVVLLASCSPAPFVMPYARPLAPPDPSHGVQPELVTRWDGCLGVDLRMDRAALYWRGDNLDGSSQLLRTDRKTRTTTVLLHDRVAHIALGKSFIYFAQDSTVYRMTKTGGVPERVVQAPTWIAAIEARGDDLWIALSREPGGIYRVNGQSLDRIFPGHALALTVTDDAVVWSDHVHGVGTRLEMASPLDTAQKRTIAIEHGFLPFFVGGGFVYAGEWRHPLAGGAPHRVGLATLSFLGADARFAYAQREGRGIWRLSHDGFDWTTFADDRGGVASFALDDATACWITQAERSSFVWCVPT